MPRINQGVALAQEFNSLIPRANELGLGLSLLNPTSHFNRSLLRARIAELRSQISGFSVQVSGLAQTFGVEFEFYLPRGGSRYALATALTNAGVSTRVENYNHATRTCWKIVTDGSLGNYERGSELVSPILSGNEGLELVRKAAAVLIQAGCKVSKKCGFHVHVGARGHGIQFFRNILRLYKKFEPVIDRVLTPSRRSNYYCSSVRFDDRRLEAATTIDDLARDPQLRDRHRKLNLDAYWRHGTVEFRQHQGTIEAEKATMWVRIALRMTAAALTKSKEDLEASEVSLAGFLKLVEAEASEAEYLHHRAAFFAHREARA